MAANAAWCAAHGVHAVIGTTGLSAAALAAMEERFAPGPANCVYAPNFAIGAVLMMRFAELAAPWFETVEVIELHHDGKLDSPSGTALQTARRMAAAREKARPESPESPESPGTSPASAGSADQARPGGCKPRPASRSTPSACGASWPTKRC